MRSLGANALAGCQLLILFAACLSSSPAVALQAEYHAGSGTMAFDPTLFGWFPIDTVSMSGPIVRSVVDSQFSNQPAWQVTDPAVGGSVPNYNAVLQGPPLSEALNNAWRFQATARLVDDFGAGPTQGLSVYLNNIVYLLMIDRATNGQLQAYLFDGASRPLRAHTIATGAAAFGYFDYELRYDPGPKLVTLLVNGVVRDTWDGEPTSPHENLIRWGSGWPNGAGQMNFRQVKFFTAEPPARSGDFNGDSRVDAADYVVWRDNLGRPFPAADGNGDGTVNAADYLVWRSGFGAQLGAAATTAVPEPTTRLLLLPTLAIVGRRNCRRFDRKAITSRRPSLV